jgi:hypothetical protein
VLATDLFPRQVRLRLVQNRYDPGFVNRGLFMKPLLIGWLCQISTLDWSVKREAYTGTAPIRIMSAGRMARVRRYGTLQHLDNRLDLVGIPVSEM